jgi:hypothetical protein
MDELHIIKQQANKLVTCVLKIHKLIVEHWLEGQQDIFLERKISYISEYNNYVSKSHYILYKT